MHQRTPLVNSQADCTFAASTMKQFNVPLEYRSPLITAVKNYRKTRDKLKKDFTPALLDFGPIRIYLARHFGFCYGVENAIDISFRTVNENNDKRIFLLSEMIHNPKVNNDLQERGVKFLMDTMGKTLIPFDELTAEDIVIIPAFGTTPAIEQTLEDIGIEIKKYNTTCPFVEKVWNRAEAISKNDYSIIVHGKPEHEETRATFGHSALNAPTIIVRDMQEAIALSKYITGEKPANEFYHEFRGQHSLGFNVLDHLQRIGVVNQTTMLATETTAIAEFLKQVMIQKYNPEEDAIGERFADTRDTLCYATYDNQSAVYGLLQTDADIAIVVGGYNSSNTSHLAELCEEKFPTYFINGEEKILSRNTVLHFNDHIKEEITTREFLPQKVTVKICLTSGASCPDAMVEEVITKLVSFYPSAKSMEKVISEFTN
ncbi:MAG: 4-hydroxy-3-methylbut-2-enyl diphosphate reductase [Ginsengibacter sp.]